MSVIDKANLIEKSRETVEQIMPVAVARAASAPSNAAIRASNIATVGLAKREY